MTARGALMLPEPGSVSHSDLRAWGIDPTIGAEITITYDVVDAFGLMVLTDTDSISTAVGVCIGYAGEHMPQGWRQKVDGATESHVNGEVNGVRGDKNGVTVNPRTAQKWATVARVAEYFAAHPGTDVATGAANLGLSERHVYRVLRQYLGMAA